jgi:hypothetical protein
MTRLIRSDAGRHTRDAENDDGATIAPPEAAPRAGLTPAVVLALQRSAGNAAVARLLAGGEPSRAAPGRARVQREPAPAPSAPASDSIAWNVTVAPGGLAEDRARKTDRPLEIFRGDTVTIRATVSGPETAQDLLEFSRLNEDDLGKLAARSEGWESENVYAWSFTPEWAGTYRLGLFGSAHEFHESYEPTVTVLMDVEDLALGIGEAILKSNERFAAAEETVHAAALAWKLASERQQAVLDAAKANEKLTEELLMGLFFAVLGGAAGGAVGGLLKNAQTIKDLGKEGLMAADAAAGALTDAAKDTAKYVVRTARKLDPGGSVPDTTGDSTAAPTAPAPAANRNAAGGNDPYTFLVKLELQLAEERKMIARELGQLVHDARNARAIDGAEDFPEDPIPMIEQDQSLQTITNDLETDHRVYLQGLWTTWLGEYAFDISVARVRDVAVIYVGSNIGSALDTGLRADAETCGTTLEAWLAKHAAPLKARLEEELKNGPAPDAAP